uniref:Secreted protein n=1 Tax=Parascaris equorum TaxID=6256 RepID=A0A914RK08_PAREQ
MSPQFSAIFMLPLTLLQYLYPTISTLHGGSICAYDSGSGTSDVLLVRSNCDISPSRIFPRFASHQRQSSGTFYGYGNNAYNYDTDCERKIFKKKTREMSTDIFWCLKP